MEIRRFFLLIATAAGFLFLILLIKDASAQSIPSPRFVPDQLGVWFETGTPQAVIDSILTQTGALQNRRRLIEGLYQLDFAEGTDLDTLIAQLQRLPEVALAARNSIGQLSVIPDDPWFSQQWGMRNTGQTGGASDVDIDADEAWNISTGSNSVTVAVVDTGIDFDHPDLAANVRSDGWNIADGNSDVSETASSSHGTAVAGIIAAIGNNFEGVAGVGWNTRILPIVWVNATTGTGNTDLDVADSIEYAADKGVELVNLSLNFLDPMPFTRLQMEEPDNTPGLEGSEMLFVYSAGNSNAFNQPGVDIDDQAGGRRYPCEYDTPNMICVAAADDLGNKPPFSLHGIRSVDLAAPGVEIFSTLDLGFDYTEPEGYGLAQQCPEEFPDCPAPYPDGTGTSFAAPHVTGIAALMKAENPSYTIEQIKDYLLLAAQPTATGTLADKTHTGNLANARVAVLAFGDSFDDAVNGNRFFSNITSTGDRWATAGTGSGERCDIFVDTVAGTDDRVAEVKYSGVAGSPGSNWTLAAYEDTYVPGASVQTLLIRVTTTDGSDFTGKSGRLGVGVVGDTGQSNPTCASTGQQYTRIAYGGAMVGGIELNTGRPFIYFSPPYDEELFSPINLAGVDRLSISLGEGSHDVTLTISNSDTGAQLFQQTIPYASPWYWTGTDKAAFVYYGNSAGNGTLLVRSFLSAR